MFNISGKGKYTENLASETKGFVTYHMGTLFIVCFQRFELKSFYLFVFIIFKICKTHRACFHGINENFSFSLFKKISKLLFIFKIMTSA